MEAQQPRLRLGSGRHHPLRTLSSQPCRRVAQHAVPPRRAPGAGTSFTPGGKDYLNFSDFGSGDDMNYPLDNSKVRYDDFIRSDGPAYTPTRRGRGLGGNMGWTRFEFEADYDEYEDDYMDEYTTQRPATLSEEKRFLNGKQILTNYDITQPLLRVIGEQKEQLGMMKREDALQAALEAQVDLLLINPQEAPPVARLMEWSKFKFEIEQGEKSKKAKAVVVETKEIRLSPKTDDHDIATKIKTTQKFLEKGNKVKLVMQFQGRQLQHKDHGKEVLLKFITDLGESAKVEGPLSFKGSMYQVVLVPGKSSSSAPSTSGSKNGKAPAQPQAQAQVQALRASTAPASTSPSSASSSVPTPPAAPVPPGPSIARPSAPLPPGQFSRPGVQPPRPAGAPAAPQPPSPPLRPTGSPTPPPPSSRPPLPPNAPAFPPLRPPGPSMQPATRSYQPVGSRQG